MTFESDYSEENVDLTEVKVGDNPAMTIGVSTSGSVFIKGDLHPLGSATALITAAAQHVPYIALSAVEVLYPADWLRGECQGDRDRLRVIDNIESFARSGFSNGARARQ